MIHYPDNIILSTNTNTNYIEYWEHVSWAYRVIHKVKPVCVFVSETQAEYDEWMPKLEKHGEVISLSAVPGIDSGNQAKLARMFAAGRYFKEGLVVINDMDLLPLAGHWLEKKIQDNYKTGSIMCIGSECYEKTADRGKFPMGNLTCEGATIHEIMNPNDLEWEGYINQFIGMADIDGKEDVSKKWFEFSDESVLRAMLKRWDKPGREIRVPLGHSYDTRDASVCRSAMEKFDSAKLANGDYVEFHCPHPYNYEQLKPFLAYIDKIYD